MFDAELASDGKMSSNGGDEMTTNPRCFRNDLVSPTHIWLYVFHAVNYESPATLIICGHIIKVGEENEKEGEKNEGDRNEKNKRTKGRKISEVTRGRKQREGNNACESVKYVI